MFKRIEFILDSPICDCGPKAQFMWSVEIQGNQPQKKAVHVGCSNCGTYLHVPNSKLVGRCRIIPPTKIKIPHPNPATKKKNKPKKHIPRPDWMTIYDGEKGKPKEENKDNKKEESKNNDKD